MATDKRKRSKTYGYRPPKHREAALDALLKNRTFGQLCEDRIFTHSRKDHGADKDRAEIIAALAQCKDFIRNNEAPNDEIYARIDENLHLILASIIDDAGRW